MTTQTLISILPLMFNGEAKPVIITADPIIPMLMVDDEAPVTGRQVQAWSEYKVHVECPFPYKGYKQVKKTVGMAKSEDVAPASLLNAGEIMQIDFDCDGFNLVVDFRIEPKNLKLESQITLSAGKVVYFQYTVDDARKGMPPYYREMSGCIMRDHHRVCDELTALAETPVMLHDDILCTTARLNSNHYLPNP